MNHKKYIVHRVVLTQWVIIVIIGLVVPLLGFGQEEKAAIKAVKSGDLELLNSYLEHHPDPNLTFSNGKTGLYYAIVSDMAKVAQFILSRGADPDFTVNDKSPLEWAIKYNRARIARFLIEYGAVVDRPDKNGDTPLIYAASLDNLEICKILVDRGANPLLTNLKEKRASNYAVYYSESLTYDYLVSMEKLYEDSYSVPSMKDGPYIYWEDEGQIVLAYYERDHESNLTRLLEHTVEIGIKDTIVQGFGWDSNSYHIKHSFTPDTCKVNTNGKIFAIGDVHGRFKALGNLLINNKIIDADLKWIFGDGQLVILGDVFDRGKLVTETLWFFYELQIQARKAGGNVHLLLGNHEVMAMTGDDRYISEKYNYFSMYMQVHYFQLFEKNTVLGRWLRSQNLIEEINGYLFLHAGISPEFDEFGYSYDEINSRVRGYLNSNYRKEKGSPEDIILGSIGPQWYRGYVKIDGIGPMVSQEFVDEYLRSNGLKMMVIGHNEQSTINTSYKGKVIFADVAIDESGKSSQGLLISGDEIFICYSDGSKVRLEK